MPPSPAPPDPLAPLASFETRLRTRLVFGEDAIERIGALARELGMRSVLLVTDPGLVAAGHPDRVQSWLATAGLRVTRFDHAEENPNARGVNECANLARQVGIDGFIGLGGGSSLDTAKGANFLLTNGGRMQDYWGYGKTTHPLRPMIAVPTTAGTGSECQSYAVIADETSHQKMACGDPTAAPQIALLDPSLTLSLPPRVTACTGLDVLGHAVESAVSRSRNPFSLLYSHAALSLAANSFPRVIATPNDQAARGRMLLAAAYAGIAIEHSMLGAAHAAANPLTARYGITHGLAVGLLLPWVVRYNAEDPATRQAYAELAVAAQIANPETGESRAVASLVECLEQLLSQSQLPTSLAEFKVRQVEVPELAREAARQWTSQFNPRPLAEANFAALYVAAGAK